MLHSSSGMPLVYVCASIDAKLTVK